MARGEVVQVLADQGRDRERVSWAMSLKHLLVENVEELRNNGRLAVEISTV